MKTIGLPSRWTLFAALVWGAVALAPTRAAAGDQTLSEAISAYENFEYEESLRLLARAEKKPSLTDAERARVHLYRGLIRFTLGDSGHADEEFKKALTLNRRITPPADTSPKILAVFDKVKKSLPPAKEDKAVKPPPGGETRVVTRPPPAPAPAPARKGRLWTWVAAGVGAAAMIGGGVAGGLALKAEKDFDAEPDAGPARSLKDKAETDALAANVLFGVGGAVLVTAVVLFFVEGSDDGPDTATDTSVSVAPGFTPGGAGVQASFRF